MTAYSFGDVVLVGFPFTNLNTIKKRPAVVISSQAYQQQRLDIILMAITSQIKPPLTIGEIILHDWQQAGLLKPSLLKPLIATIEQQKVIKFMGKLSDIDKIGLEKSIRTILAT